MRIFKFLTCANLARAAGAVAVACVCLLLNHSRTPTELETVLAAGKITVISRNGTTTYYEGRTGLTGFEYTLANAFAEHLGVELEIREEEDLAAILNGVGTELGHFAALGLTVTAERQQQVRFSQPYMTITQQLIYRHGTAAPASVEDLVGKKIVVIANSSHAEKLRELRRQLPALSWEERSDGEMFDLIEMVHRGDIDYTIVDSNVYDINRNLFPEALVAFELSGPQELAWAFAKSTDSSLYDAAQRFFAEYEGSGRLADIRDSYYGNNEVVDRTSALVLSQRIEKRLPRLRQHLEAAAREQNLEWELLAAVSYQESHWDPRAVSPTGVRGLMMLTTPTAREMGVRDRTDPKQSIFGGARYLTALQDYIPEQVQGDDRLWMTLAAYNLGPGHLKDARVLTQRRGGNPDSWEDVKATLPLLSNRQYYRNARHGYARGREAVKYVENIRSFYTVLVWHSQMEARRVALASTQQQTAPAADPAFPPLSLNDSGQRRLSRL